MNIRWHYKSMSYCYCIRPSNKADLLNSLYKFIYVHLCAPLCTNLFMCVYLCVFSVSECSDSLELAASMTAAQHSGFTLLSASETTTEKFDYFNKIKTDPSGDWLAKGQVMGSEVTDKEWDFLKPFTKSLDDWKNWLSNYHEVSHT